MSVLGFSTLHHHMIAILCLIVLGWGMGAASAIAPGETSLLLRKIISSPEGHSRPVMPGHSRHVIHRRDAEEKPLVRSLSIDGEVVNRFSVTQVRSEMENPSYSEDKEAVFTIQIPEEAFISNFTMITNDELFIAEIKGKEEAQKQYEKAKDNDQTAGTVRAQPRDLAAAARGMEIFSVAVNVAPNSSVQFELTYQQTLTRQRGVYKYITSIRPEQVVEKLTFSLQINEKDGLTSLTESGPNADQFHTHNNLDSRTDYLIQREFSEDEQKSMDATKGLNGDLIIRYDINHQDGIGNIQVEGNTFIQSFAPTNLVPLPKNIAFVIDISGSMSGRKIDQTAEAMLTILDQLRSDDMFNIILFDDSLKYWPTSDDDYEGDLIGQYEKEVIISTQPPPFLPLEPRPRPLTSCIDLSRLPKEEDLLSKPSQRNRTEVPEIPERAKRDIIWRKPPVNRIVTGMVKATKYNIEKAQEFSKKFIKADGSTNIHDALREAVKILKRQERENGNSVVFLTDGEPTAGITRPKAIVESVATAARKTEHSGSVQIYSLGFGFNLNYDLLEMLSKSTDGRVKRIYEEADATVQLTNFYEEIGTPLAYELDFMYDENMVDLKTLTKARFPQFHQGTEVLIAGKFRKDVMKTAKETRRKRSVDIDIDDLVIIDPPVVCCFGLNCMGYDDNITEYREQIEIDVDIDFGLESEHDCFKNKKYNTSNTWQPSSYADRLWANLKIKDLLRISDTTFNKKVQKKAKKIATCLALQYHLVTPVTSLIIVTDTNNAFDPVDELSYDIDIGAAPGMPQGIIGPQYSPQRYGKPNAYPGPSGSHGRNSQGFYPGGLPGLPGLSPQSMLPPTTSTTTTMQTTTTVGTTTMAMHTTTSGQEILKQLSGVFYQGKCGARYADAFVSYYQIIAKVTNQKVETQLMTSIQVASGFSNADLYEFIAQVPINSSIHHIIVYLPDGSTHQLYIGSDRYNIQQSGVVEKLEPCKELPSSDTSMKRYSLLLDVPEIQNGKKIRVKIYYEENLIEDNGIIKYKASVWQNYKTIHGLFFYMSLEDKQLDAVVSTTAPVPLSVSSYTSRDGKNHVSIHGVDMSQTLQNANEQVTVFLTP